MKTKEQIVEANKTKLAELHTELEKVENGRKTKSKPFQIKELEGRIKALEAFPHLDILFTKGQYTAYDAYTLNENGTTKSMIEIKDRFIPSTKYTDAQFEAGKLKNMVAIGHTLGVENLIFMAHYSDDVTAIWLLNNYLDKTPIGIMCPYQTMGNSTMVEKQMIFLPLSEAKIVSRQISKQIYNETEEFPKDLTK